MFFVLCRDNYRYRRHIVVIITDMLVIAHNIRSLHNVGAIFRSAAAFGVEKLFLTGYSPTPPRKEIAKVALGAERLIPWEQGDILPVIEQCKKAGYTVLALEQTPGAKFLSAVSGEKIALILGNEVTGIEPEVLAVCDSSVVIPMHAKRSLNVSVAAGVAMYALRMPKMDQ
ncbi:TrmH family RNA methyltransferase [bacterium]|nr:TrmH family RNA methyltransferase [bacterium]